MEKRFLLDVIAYYPMSFQSGFFRELASNDQIDLKVYYLWGKDAAERHFNREFNTIIEVPKQLLEGYDYEVVPNWAINRGFGKYFNFVNPGLVTRLLRRKPDAVLISGWNYFSHTLIWALSKIKRVNYLLRTDTNGFVADISKGTVFARTIRKSIIHGASTILYTSTANLVFYQRAGVEQARLFRSPFCVDNSYWKEKYQSLKNNIEKIKHNIGINNAAPVVVYIGKLVSRKKPMLLLQGAEPLLQRGLLNLIFVGDGEQRETLERFAKHSHLENVFFEGFVPNEKIGKYLAVGDVFVLLSSAEPFGLAVNEAMIFHNALVLSDTCGATHDLLLEGQNGYIAYESDPRSVEKALYSLVNDRETLERFKKKSGEMIEKWGPSQAAEGVVQSLTYIRNSQK